SDATGTARVPSKPLGTVGSAGARSSSPVTARARPPWPLITVPHRPMSPPPIAWSGTDRPRCESRSAHEIPRPVHGFFSGVRGGGPTVLRVLGRSPGRPALGVIPAVDVCPFDHEPAPCFGCETRRVKDGVMEKERDTTTAHAWEAIGGSSNLTAKVSYRGAGEVLPAVLPVRELARATV